MDRLLTYHSLDIQWGNHDLLCMGAAAGEPACIATVLRNNLRYDNYEILENDDGISLRAVAFADANYTAGEFITPLIKAINVLLFKLEGQMIQRHPEFDMTDRLLLDKIDHDTGTVTLADGSVWPLTTNDFPTVDGGPLYAHVSGAAHHRQARVRVCHRRSPASTYRFPIPTARCTRSPTATCCSRLARRSTKTAPLAA